jgi:hypothetical protein
MNLENLSTEKIGRCRHRRRADEVVPFRTFHQQSKAWLVAEGHGAERNVSKPRLSAPLTHVPTETRVRGSSPMKCVHPRGGASANVAICQRPAPHSMVLRSRSEPPAFGRIPLRSHWFDDRKRVTRGTRRRTFVGTKGDYPLRSPQRPEVNRGVLRPRNVPIEGDLGGLGRQTLAFVGSCLVDSAQRGRAPLSGGYWREDGP